MQVGLAVSDVMDQVVSRSPIQPELIFGSVAGRRYIRNRGQSSWVLTAHFLSEQWE